MPHDLACLTPCTYCGLVADTVDHVTPRSVMAMLPDGIESPITARTVTVPACRECNSALGNRIYGNGTLKERRAAAKAHLRRKYAHYLRIPAWSEDELAELGQDLAADIRRSLRVQALTRERLAW